MHASYVEQEAATYSVAQSHSVPGCTHQEIEAQNATAASWLCLPLNLSCKACQLQQAISCAAFDAMALSTSTCTKRRQRLLCPTPYSASQGAAIAVPMPVLACETALSLP